MAEVRRGYDPQDSRFFGEQYRENMQKAAVETRWIMNRGYGPDQTITFVGNHYMLSKRQRMALYRSVMADEERALHAAKEVKELAGPVYIDGFNIIISLEVALSGSLMLLGDDGVIRDLAGLHGTYRIIDKTEPAVRLLKKELVKHPGITEIHIYLDRPVSNSGRLKALMEDGFSDVPGVTMELVDSPDRCLRGRFNVISADSIVMNESRTWYNAVSRIIERRIPEAWVYRFGDADGMV